MHRTAFSHRYAKNKEYADRFFTPGNPAKTFVATTDNMIG